MTYDDKKVHIDYEAAKKISKKKSIFAFLFLKICQAL